MNTAETKPNVFGRVMTWLGRFEAATLIGLGVVALGLWAFAEITDEVREKDSRAFDRAVLLALRDPQDLSDPLGPVWFEEMMRDVTALGGMAVLMLMTLTAVGYLLLEGKGRAAVFVAAAVVGGSTIGFLIKAIIDRPRPDVVPHFAHVVTASFPSGHSLMAAATYLTLGALLARVQARRRTKAYTLLVAILVTAAVGCSRVYLGVHWPTDVLAGWTLGSCWAVFCWLIFLRLQRRGQVEPNEAAVAMDSRKSAARSA